MRSGESISGPKIKMEVAEPSHVEGAQYEKTERIELDRDTAADHIERAHTNFIPDAEASIQRSAESMGISAETLQRAKEEFGLKQKMGALEERSEGLANSANEQFASLTAEQSAHAEVRLSEQDQALINEVETLSAHLEGSPHAEQTPSSQSPEKKENFSRSTYGGRLAEYLTGLQIDDPALPERLMQDQAMIRGKYGLPAREMRFDQPGEYENFLRDLAKKNEVRIASTEEAGSFFHKYGIAGGVYNSDNNTVYQDIDRANEKTYTKGLGTLEHELIHSLQQKRTPRMPVEEMEYEAYIAGMNFSRLKDMEDTKRIEALDSIFTMGIGRSVNSAYSEESERQQKKIKPAWNDPKYFES